MATGITESPARILRQLMVDLGVAILPAVQSTADWQTSVKVEPVAPDNVITLYDTGAVEDSGIVFDGTRNEHPTLQVRIRSSDTATQSVGYVKARQVCIALDSVYRQVTTVDAVRFIIQRVKRTTDVIFIGYDTPTSKRLVHTFNLSFTVGVAP